MRAGVEGVNLPARENTINDPSYFTAQGLKTHPLLYGLIVFERMLGAHARLVPVRIRSSRSQHLKVWAVRLGQGSKLPNRLNVPVINKGHRSAVIDLHLPASAAAPVQRLLALLASSTLGVTLAGQRLGHQAEWQSKMQLATIRPTRPGYVLGVRGDSAPLLTVRIRPTTLVAPLQESNGPQPLFGDE